MKVNNKGILRDKYVKREAMKIFIIGPVYSIVMIFLTYLSMSKWIAFFYAVVPFFILMMIFFIIIAPIVMLKRHNKTIKRISFGEGYVVIEVFSALWMKSNEYKFPKNAIKVVKSKFPWYGRNEVKEGYTIKAGPDKIFYLVKDFFSESDFDYIKKNLLN
ncbi:hypothetical protein LA303_09270 [Candidatus Sulfidibacterium hydrothermale]|uniref:hypothetical protein n=1 Tax=Candidatus Sulfidibacterium hydrothermale TaxID=2875962 RepID=UPI001F0AEAF3|nr:hypothetical protein [Candidatus Sulfidibacterium hydrothermale]UBM61602.1 hypothetical protein LA303_09270 [Candidatus Sulfidibacterium hydrothermale]